LWICPGPKSWKLVIRKTSFYVIIFVDLLNHILLAKFSIVQQEVIVGMAKTLDENKHV
jgi:hypothetical protein